MKWININNTTPLPLRIDLAGFVAVKLPLESKFTAGFLCFFFFFYVLFLLLLLVLINFALIHRELRFVPCFFF